MSAERHALKAALDYSKGLEAEIQFLRQNNAELRDRLRQLRRDTNTAREILSGGRDCDTKATGPPDCEEGPQIHEAMCSPPKSPYRNPPTENAAPDDF